MSRGPVMIPILRIAGVLALVAAAALVLLAVFRNEGLGVGELVLAGAAAATALFLFGFATNLRLLEDIRRHLARDD